MGWLFGAGQLAMTAHDLAVWNLAVMNQSILRPESYRTQQTEVVLQTGNATGYGLGVSISAPGGRRRISHGGAVSGYSTSNDIYPDDRAAIVVLTNIYLAHKRGRSDCRADCLGHLSNNGHCDGCPGAGPPNLR